MVTARVRVFSFLALLVFAFGLFGFAKPRDPRVTAIVVPELGSETIETIARKHLERSDGVVLVVAVADHRMRIETGPHARSVLSDADALEILDHRMAPLLREGRTDDAVDAGIADIERALARRPPAPQFGAALLIPIFIGLAVFVAGMGAVALSASASRRTGAAKASAFVPVHVPVHVVHVDTSSSSSCSGGGASSSW